MKYLKLGLQLGIFFAANPHESLTSKEIASKFGVGAYGVPSTLRDYVEDGYFVRQRSAGGSGRMSVYSAGPRLLQLIGRTTV